MDHDEAIELQRRGLEAFFRVMATAAEGSRLAEYPGVVAAIVPASPRRSFPNSVVYESAEELSAALDPLAVEYRHARVEAWTVWVPEEDRAARGLLEAAGHRLDVAPAAMAIELDDLPDPDPGDLDWDAEATADEVGRINEIAYGNAEGFAAAFTRPSDASLHLYRARVDAETAAVAGVLDVDEDALLTFVATDPAHRGRGLARRLSHVAVSEARDRGCRTSSLQASQLGRPVYDRLGYHAFGTIGMWERRGSR
jgi:GNAT superfamily N-acetyltransferase